MNLKDREREAHIAPILFNSEYSKHSKWVHTRIPPPGVHSYSEEEAFSSNLKGPVDRATSPSRWLLQVRWNGRSSTHRSILPAKRTLLKISLSSPDGQCREFATDLFESGSTSSRTLGDLLLSHLQHALPCFALLPVSSPSHAGFDLQLSIALFERTMGPWLKKGRIRGRLPSLSFGPLASWAWS